MAKDPTGTQSGSLRVFREGGLAFSTTEGVANRKRSGGGFQVVNLGFRLVRTSLAESNAADSEAAEQRCNAAAKAAEAMDYEQAEAKLAEVQNADGVTRFARWAEMLQEELVVIGKPVADLSVERWCQGETAAIEETTLLMFLTRCWWLVCAFQAW